MSVLFVESEKELQKFVFMIFIDFAKPFIVSIESVLNCYKYGVERLKEVIEFKYLRAIMD